MARDDNWTVWFGKLMGTAILTPIAVFFTYKANNDSVVFNIDLYKSILMRILGLRSKRHIEQPIHPILALSTSGSEAKKSVPEISS